MLAIYTRLSVEDSESNSIKNQIREGKNFAKEKKFSYKIYDEGMGVSGGADIENRPKLKELIDDITREKIKAVWIRDQNRLERNQLTFHFFVDLVNKKDVKIFIVDKEVDYKDPDTFFKTSLDSLFNAKRRIEQSVSTKRALHDNLKEGKSRGGIMAYGFTKDKENYVIKDEYERKIVTEIYNLSLSGKGTRAIATILNDRNIPTRYNTMDKGVLKTKNKYTGKISIKNKSDIQWAQNTIRSILRNPIYKGEKYFGKNTERKLYKYPVIINPELWTKVQENLTKRKNGTGKKVNHQYLLKGILECGRCGKNYYGKINSRTSIYMCSSKRNSKENCGNRGINISAIEGYIWGRLFMSQGVKDSLVKHLDDSGKEEKIVALQKTISRLENEIQKAKKAKTKAIQLLLAEEFSEEEFRPEKKRLNEIIKNNEIDINSIKDQLKDYETAIVKKKEISKDLKLLDEISFITKREVINKYIKRIKVFYIDPIYILKVLFVFDSVESHVLPKDYKIGVMMDTMNAYPLYKGVNVEGELEKLQIILEEKHPE